MADTRIQLEAEDWVRREWLPEQYGQKFRRERLRLTSGGVFDFDAVSLDDSIVVSISTSGASTSSGKGGVGKLMKLRADMLFLNLAEAKKRIIALTEHDMYELCQKEKRAGRVPLNIDFVYAELPANLATRLKEARKIASSEVSPARKE
ncbi:MAG TPA: hypothetical protein VLZ89_05040 [Anaerolineales bacterium]|nr:hypothetical protein [Anaerolineales bacterium]